MISKNVLRDSGVYNTLLNAIEATKDPIQYSKFLEKIYQQQINDGIAPEFNKYLNCALVCQNKQFFSSVLEEMQRRNTPRDKTTFNLLIQFYQDDPVRMFQAWDEMRERKLVPVTRSYNIVISTNFAS